MPIDEVSDELHGEVMLAARLAMYFHTEDKVLGMRLSAKTFSFLNYFMNHRKMLFQLIFEAAILNGYIKGERQRLKEIIEKAISVGADATLKVLEDFTGVEDQAQQAVKRLEIIQAMIESGEWRKLDARQS